MKGKQLALILVLLVVVGGAAWFLKQRNAGEWSKSATTATSKILDFPLNDVSHLTIRSGAAEVNLVKKDELWTVSERADYPADFGKISTLLRKLWELRPVQDVKVGPSQLGRLELTDPGEGRGASLLDLKRSDGSQIAALLLGKSYVKNSDSEAMAGGGIAAGRYVMERTGSNRVFLVAETFSEIETKPEHWLDHDFIKVENPKAISVTGPAPAMTWAITRENNSGPWKFADEKRNEETDPATTSTVATAFANLPFGDVLAPDAPPAETGLDKPSTVRIETFDNFVYEVRIGKLTGENYPVMTSVSAELAKERVPAADEKPEDKAKLDQEFQARQKRLTDKLAQEQKFSARPYLVAKGTIDQVLKDRSELIKKSSPSPAASPDAKAGPSPKASVATSPVEVPSPKAKARPRKPRK